VFDDLQNIFGMKVWFTTPVTAAFGGTHNMSPAATRALFQCEHFQLRRVESREDQKRMYEEWQPGRHLLMEKLAPLLNPGEQALLPSPKDERGVSNFIAFLKDYQSVVFQAEAHLQNIYKYGKDQDRAMGHAQEWRQCLEDIKKESKKLQDWSQAAPLVTVRLGPAWDVCSAVRLGYQPKPCSQWAQHFSVVPLGYVLRSRLTNSGRTSGRSSAISTRWKMR